MKNLAVVLARSGSKGLPNKNIMNMAGKPLLAYTVMAAFESNMFDKVHVSTDSQYYADIATRYGADVPFLREKALAGDNSSSWDALRYVVMEYKKRGVVFDTVTLLQPTSPLRDAIDIQNAFKVFEERKALAVVSVCEAEYSPLLCNTLPDNNSLNMFIDINKVGRRQDMKTFYRLNGAIYIQKTELLMNSGNLYGEKTYAYIMDKYHSIDIDDEMDFYIAESIIRKRSNM